ncbi:MAG: radical SAM protein [Candidatus Zixiibacteriota bacterium]|nr:MAG: radical SAM protein [candidate division Zixibacteria bacterium]
MNIVDAIPQKAEVSILNLAASVSFLRPTAAKFLEKVAYHYMIERNTKNFPVGVQRDKLDMLKAMISSTERGLSQGLIGKNAQHKLVEVLLGKIMLKPDDISQQYVKKHGMNPPGFIVIAPTGRCNLKCKGCYAGSDPSRRTTMPYEIIDRIMEEKKNLWRSHFTVITGGEPFLYKDDGENILDLFERHSDQYFLVYTNGTLITPKVAKRLGELGNVTPAISVEGFEKETDDRRGKGVFKLILKAFENLRNAGVPFGISTTGFKHNAERILDDEFIDFFFEQQGALYQWLFQYMPIGRSYTLEMMVTPEQRLSMYERTWKLVRERKLFVADFWNSGVVSNGCISAGGGYGGGYFYIDWNGAVAPCAFNPFSVHNIKDVYASGGDLNTVVFSSLFKDVRNWQRKYFYDKPNCERGNLLVPCPIRDHHREMRAIIDKVHALPIDENGAKALEDHAYGEGLAEYGDKVGHISCPIWEEKYLLPERKRMAG